MTPLEFVAGFLGLHVGGALGGTVIVWLWLKFVEPSQG
jgi:hypothetical protein